MSTLAPRRELRLASLHGHAEPDGIVWRSRHYDDAYPVLPFADRVPRRELEVVTPPVPLVVGRGRERLFELAERAGITLVD